MLTLAAVPGLSGRASNARRAISQLKSPGKVSISYESDTRRTRPNGRAHGHHES